MGKCILLVLLILPLCIASGEEPGPKSFDRSLIGWSVCEGVSMTFDPKMTPEVLASWLKKAVKLDEEQSKKIDVFIDDISGKQKKLIALSKEEKAYAEKWLKRMEGAGNDRSKVKEEGEQWFKDHEKKIVQEFGKDFSPAKALREGIDSILKEEQRAMWQDAFIENYKQIATPARLELGGSKQIQGKLLARSPEGKYLMLVDDKEFIVTPWHGAVENSP